MLKCHSANYSSDLKQKIKILKSLNIYRYTVCKIIKRFLLRGNVEPAIKSDKPRKTNARMDNIIVRKVRNDSRIMVVNINKKLK